jgi:hypothetical protein
LPFLAGASVAEAYVARPSPTTTAPSAPPTSKTRALVDAIRGELPDCDVVITDNRSVLLSQATRRGRRVVRVHQMFLDAPPEIRAATARFLAGGDRKHGVLVDQFIDSQAHLLAMAARPLKDDAHKGSVHDLMPIYDEVNDRYFEAAISAEIGWGQAPKKARRRTITFGSYDHRARRIVIHPALDQTHVPRVVVERIVHHEMLHAKHGEERDPGGRRVVHGRAFRRDEARFAGAKEADVWLESHLDELLRWKKRKTK